MPRQQDHLRESKCLEMDKMMMQLKSEPGEGKLSIRTGPERMQSTVACRLWIVDGGPAQCHVEVGASDLH
jgi:hypothetical protein